MSTAAEGGSEAGGAEYRAGSAREFAQRALDEADGPVEPASLKAEYGCSGGHMRSVLCDLVAEGEAQRVGHGEYVAGDTPDSPPAQDAEAADDAAPEAGVEGVSGAVDEEVAEAVDEATEEEVEEAVGDVEEETDGFVIDGEEWGLPPGKALVAGTVVLALVVLVLASRSGEESAPAQDGAESDESPVSDSFDGWS